MDGAVVGDGEVEGGLLVGLLDRADVLDRPPELGEGLGFVGVEVGEVGLVVGEDAGHEFGVGAVGVG